MHFSVGCVLRGSEVDKLVLVATSDLHDRGLVAAAVAVIGGGPQRDKRAISKIIDMSLFDELVRAHDSLELVHLQKLIDDLLAEEVSSAAVVDRPPLVVSGVGVRPHQVAHGAALGNVLSAVDVGDAVEEGQRGGETSVHAEDRVVHYCSQGQIGEDLDDLAPDVVVAVLPNHLVVEAVGASERGRLVVAAQEDEGVGVQAF